MAVYAIGDVQGCYRSLMALLDKLELTQNDEVWFVGDLVNRGPRSLEVLRFLQEPGIRTQTVLGNHDVWLLARHLGLSKEKKRDTLDEVLAAKDKKRIIEWLRHQRFAHAGKGALMVHAGVHPSWDVEDVLAISNQLEATLQGKDGLKLLERFVKGKVTQWDAKQKGLEGHLGALVFFTTVRVCTKAGLLPERFTGPPSSAPEGYFPWYQVPNRRTAETVVVFGHWASQGLYVGETVLGIDTGCVWGEKLTAIRMSDRKVFQVNNLD